MAIFLIRDKATNKTGLMDYSISRNEKKWENRQEFNYSQDLLNVVPAVQVCDATNDAILTGRRANKKKAGAFRGSSK